MRDARHEPPTAARVLGTVRRVLAAPVVVAALVFGSVGAQPVAADGTWSRNLYVSGAFLYQDPYYTACTAAATMIMLNTIAYRDTGGDGFRWTPYRVQRSSDPTDYRDMTSILAFSRANDTLRATSPGSDAHGWRNALNYFGWGPSAMTDASKMVYADRAYSSFSSAVKAAVKAIARWKMPVGVLAWAGGHAQVMTGYVVTGADPATSDAFTVQYVYLSDPLRSNGLVNHKVGIEALRIGALRYRYQWYRETDSPYDDPYTAGWARSSVSAASGASEWYHRWVLIVPVRDGLPSGGPDPSPTPTPTPSPTDSPTPSPSQSASPDPSPSSSPTASPQADAGVASSPSPTASPSPSPTPDSPSPAAPPAPAATPADSPTPTATPSPSPTPSTAPPA